MDRIAEPFEKIAAAIRRQRCVIFFGSGISAGSGLPTGSELIRQLLNLDPARTPRDLDLAMAAQVARHREGPDWLVSRIQDIFLSGNLQPNELHKILALLNCKYYVTTNYDRLFDRTLKEVLGPDLHVVVRDQDIPHADPVTYIKLHGDIARPDTIVLTYDDYDMRFEQNPNLLHLLYSLFAQHLVLFVGYSLRDPNVLSVVRKIGRGNPRYARGMYILVTEPDEERADFFRSLNVEVLTVERGPDETQGQALQRLLLRLWNCTLDFDIYLNPEPRQLSYSSRLEIAISSYRRGDYRSAVRLIQDLALVPERIWEADPGAFAQYAYFKLKTLDKLNRWPEMKRAGGAFLEQLARFAKLYPEQVLRSIEAQIHASIGLPLLRASFFDDARRHLEAALDWHPDEVVIGNDAMLLHADRHTVLACIDLARSLLDAAPGDDLLPAAAANLDRGWKLFQTYDDPDGPGERHFLGRYFGARMFLLAARVRRGERRFDEAVAGELRDYGLRSHREGVNRVPYGKVAGKYCEAIAHLVIACEHRKAQEPARAAESFDRCTGILEKLLSAEGTEGEDESRVQLSPLEVCKFHRALEAACRGRADLGDGDGAGLLERARRHHERFLELKGALELQSMNQAAIEHEHWIFTPLN